MIWSSLTMKPMRSIVVRERCNWSWSIVELELSHRYMKIRNIFYVLSVVQYHMNECNHPKQPMVAKCYCLDINECYKIQLVGVFQNIQR